MIQASVVLEIFCSNFHWLIMRKTEKGDNSVMVFENLTKVIQVIFTSDTICGPVIMTLTEAVLWIFCSQASIGLQCNNN